MTLGQSRPFGPTVPPPRRRGVDPAVLTVVLVSILSIVGHLLALPVLTRSEPEPPATAGPSTATTTSPPPPGGGTTAPTTGTGTTAVPTPTAVPAVPAYDSACLRSDNPATGARVPAGDPFGTDLAHLGAKSELQRLYAVHDGTLTPIDGLGAPRRCDQQLLALMIAVAPTLVPRVDELLVFDSNPRAGRGDWVVEGESTPRDKNGKKSDPAHWRLSFAPNGLDRAVLAWLVAHELAHVASLSSDQILDGIGPDYCATWYTNTGCLIADSLLVRYLHNTWPDDLRGEWEKADAVNTTAARRTALSAFYRAHESSFVTEYAATHPMEDFAESLALWCTVAPTDRDRTRLPTAHDSDSGSKVAWFDSAKRDLLPIFGPGCQMLRSFAAR